MKEIAEMTTIELFEAAISSLRADKEKATALRNSVTSGTGQSLYTNAQREAALIASQKLAEALDALKQASTPLSDAIAVHNNAQRRAVQKQSRPA